MYTLYVLKSKKDNLRYVGMTAKDPNMRVEEHNSNKNRFTRGHQPWKLIYTECYRNKEQAFLREKFLKSGQGRKWITEKIDNI